MKLSEGQVQAFQNDSYLVAEDVVTDADMVPVIAEYETWIERRAQALLAEGTIPNPAAGEPFGQRFALCPNGSDPFCKKRQDHVRALDLGNPSVDPFGGPAQIPAAPPERGMVRMETVR